MDSDMELSDDEIFDSDQNFFDYPPFLSGCQTEVESSESFYKCFIRRYHACPAFFMGSLQNACESSFNSAIVEERRPILVYIHHDKSLFSNIFCSNILCSEIMIDYLLENYIVWPWDITYQSNKNKLMDILKNFSTQFSSDFSVEECPMLIGIMHRSTVDNDWLSSIDYKCTLLQQGDRLSCIELKTNCERLLNELIVFKEQFDENEQNLSFDFVKTTGLCWEIFLEITKYLYLEDIVYAFSVNILSFLNKYNTRLHLSDSSHEFIDMVLRKTNPTYPVSLRLTTSYRNQTLNFASSSIFTNIVALTLINFDATNQIKKCKTYFPNLICLSLWFDYEMNYKIIINIFQKLENPIKRFELHCAKLVHTGYYTNLSDSNNIPNRTIEYFLLEVNCFKLNSKNNTFFIIRTIGLIKLMINIRYVHLMINNNDLKRFLDRNQWKYLVNDCDQLRKITLQVIKDMVEDKEWTQNLQEIQKELRAVRETIKFQVI